MIVASALVALACAAPAGAATTIGSDLADTDLSPDPEDSVACSPSDEPCTYTNPALFANAHPVIAPGHGVISRWRVRASNLDAPVSVALRALRPAAAGAYTGLATSAAASFPTAAMTTVLFATRLPIRAGDAIGLDVGAGAGNLLALTDSQPTTHLVRWQPPLADGVALAPDFPFGAPDPEVTFNADVEPDLDCDGFGDETQDASVPGDCPVGLTKTPKRKLRVRKKRAKVSFAFAGPPLASGAQCSLDGVAFFACGSPFRATVKRGRHEFAVRALDPDGAPGAGTSYAFKVLKKKKKRSGR